MPYKTLSPFTSWDQIYGRKAGSNASVSSLIITWSQQKHPYFQCHSKTTHCACYWITGSYHSGYHLLHWIWHIKFCEFLLNDVRTFPFKTIVTISDCSNTTEKLIIKTVISPLCLYVPDFQHDCDVLVHQHKFFHRPHIYWLNCIQHFSLTLTCPTGTSTGFDRSTAP